MSDNRKGKKRPKSYYIKCAAGGKKSKRVNDLDAGMKGFLVTCNKYEKETVREMYNLLNEYADEMYGPEMKADKTEDGSDSGSEDEDMEKAMAKHVTEMKQVAKSERRFQNTDTKTKNCIFIRTIVDNPCDLAHKMFSDIVGKQVQKARYALRLVPIMTTCKSNMNSITEAAKVIFKPHFETDFGVGVKYTSVCKIRNNQSVSRMSILPALGSIIREMNPLHTLCHDDPDLTVVIEIIRNVCCLSVVRDYFTFRKYNFHEILKKTNDENQEKKIDEKTGKPENIKKDDSDGEIECNREEKEDGVINDVDEYVGADKEIENVEDDL